MPITLKMFSVPFAIMLITILGYLFIVGKLNRWSFAGSLVGVAILVGVVAVVLPRSEEVSELGGEVAGQEILVKKERVRADIYAKAEVVQLLIEHVEEVSVSKLTHPGRFSPKNLDELLLKERDRLAEMMLRASIHDNRIQEIIAKVTDVVTRDMARDVWHAVPKEIFTTGAAKGQNQAAVSRKFHDVLVGSKVGTAQDVVEEFLKPLDGWTSEVKAKAAVFDAFRADGVLPVNHVGPEED